ncbi:MAG: haloacid dehalogenase [Candidatus Rokuibacteriota bacterium]|nr:MAG: haloacid dehalogenase [Candidatus Rokubacteria bacterium]
MHGSPPSQRILLHGSGVWARYNSAMRAIEAVVFDIGGVVQESPLHAIARYERDHGLPPGAINRAVVAAGEAGAWARLERGELTVESFLAPFAADCRAWGVEVDGGRLMASIADASRPRPRMLAAVRTIRERGLRVGALTNNWVTEGRRPTDGLRTHFDVFVESAVVGLRKPDPRIYALVCRELRVPPSSAAFLDDIGMNLKPARALGMATIEVDDPEGALRELSALLGFDL